jgi:hypothetical protein
VVPIASTELLPTLYAVIGSAGLTLSRAFTASFRYALSISLMGRGRRVNRRLRTTVNNSKSDDLITHWRSLGERLDPSLTIPRTREHPLPSLTLEATSYTVSFLRVCRLNEQYNSICQVYLTARPNLLQRLDQSEILVDFKAWMLRGPRQKENTTPLGSEKWKAPWHRTAIDRGASFPTRAGSSPGV